MRERERTRVYWIFGEEMWEDFPGILQLRERERKGRIALTRLLGCAGDVCERFAFLYNIEEREIESDVHD